MRFEIDKVVPLAAPSAIDVIAPEPVEHTLPGGQRLFIEGQQGVDIEVVFGNGIITADQLIDLETKRGRQGLHTITFENILCNEIVDLYVYMPRVPRTSAGVATREGQYVYTENRLSFKQVKPSFSLVQFNWFFFENNGYSIGDGKFCIKMPAAGAFLEEGLSGYWFNMTGGAGESIDIQLRNSTHAYDYLSTDATFEIDSGTSLLEGGVFQAFDFVKEDIICLDIDAVTSIAPPNNSMVLVVQALCLIFGA